MPLILIPAYGRRYREQKDAIADWGRGLDFKVMNGPYTSVRDKETLVKDFGTVLVWSNYPNSPIYWDITKSS